MTLLQRFAIALPLLAFVSCASPSAGTATGTARIEAPEGQAPAAVAEGAFVTTATAASGTEALAAARDSAARQYLGQGPVPPELQAAFEAHLHVLPLGPAPGGEQARAWVDNVALRALVAAKLAETPAAAEPTLPLLATPQVKAALQVLDDAATQASWCALYVRSGWEACPDDSRPDRMRTALSQAAADLKLQLVPSDGTPYKPGQPPYRPLVLQAVAGPQSAPHAWAQLPLRLQAPADLLAAQTGVTDAEGRWEVPWQRVLHPSDVITAQVDTQALMGPTHAPLWNGSPISVKTRALTWKTVRVLVSVKSSMHRNDPLVQMARARVLEGLNQHLPGATLAFSASNIAKEGHTQLASMGHDVLVQADISWAFASALGGRSVWYEARAALEGVNLWSQETFANFQPTVQEAGIGDKHAAKQAVNKLASEVAKQTAEAIKVALPDPL